MALQYITDNLGKRTAVIILIDDWENITEMHNELKDLEGKVKSLKKYKPSDFQGCISKETALQMIADIELD